jgi:hypothetical protein
MGPCHRKLVLAVQQRVGGQCRGFTKAVLKAMGVDRSRYDKKAVRFRHEARCLDGGLPLPRGITPDVFVIKPVANQVVCYEIEAASTIDAERLVPYVNWFWFLDDQEWKLRLFSVRAYSSHGVAAELDLFGISTTWFVESKTLIVGQLGLDVDDVDVEDVGC